MKIILKILRNIFCRSKDGIGKNVIFHNSQLGENSYINYNSIIANSQIGKFCSIGPNCVIGLGDHPTSFVSTSPYFYNNKNKIKSQLEFNSFQSVIIKNDVWIGANVTIRNGITIGNGVVVGANSVVTKNLEDYGVYVGVPARLIRKRFNDDQVSKLLSSEWWNKSSIWIDKNIKAFEEIERFIEISDKSNG